MGKGGLGPGPVTSSYSVAKGDEAGSLWQKTAAGANTKAQSTGEFFDKDGNRVGHYGLGTWMRDNAAVVLEVTYTKEMYTSSDPGKEFSMLTQEEKKVLEAPVEPGVISRHVTTKFNNIPLIRLLTIPDPDTQSR